MSLSRRKFLLTTGSCGLALGIAGTMPRSTGAVVAAGDADAQARHILERCTFGVRQADLAHVAEIGVQAYIEQQLNPESIPDHRGEARTRRLETLRCPTGELFEYKPEILWKELATAKLLRACYSERQLHEVMVDFWTDHFNIDSSKGDCPWLKTADDREVIRKHALGKFPALLRASALGPAMLWYLDGRANRRGTPEEAPNENYARELLELHTLGVHGGYTQQDVMEIARCLTGWTVRTDTWFGKGRVEFVVAHHDDTSKEVLGVRIPAGLGAKDVDRVLEIVTAHPSTAQYIATKMCHRFIGPDAPSAAVASVAARFTATGGDIPESLRALFATEAFQNPQSAKFKRPFRFLVSVMRAVEADIATADALLDYLARMGHSPFQFPTPDGYPEEAGPWFGSMLWRWHLVYALSRNEVPGVAVDWAGLEQQAGGGTALVARILGREPSADELRLAKGGIAPALIMASPAFQGC